MQEHDAPQWTSNRTAKKSKAGCKTCKLRKVKCDEGRPVCGKCKVYFANRVVECFYDYGDPGHKKTRRKQSKPQMTGHVSVEHVSIELGLLSRQQFIPNTPGSVLLDPFDTQTKTSLPNANELLHHYLSGIVKVCVPAGHSPVTNPFVRGWWSMIQGDHFLHHIMLQSSAVELEWLKGAPNVFHSDRYTREVMRQLRDRVQDPNMGISNQTIAAVANLAALEYGKGNMTMVKMHIDGLKRMVHLRGGLSKIKESSKVTAIVAHWFSLLTMHESIFPPDGDTQSPLLPSRNQIDYLESEKYVDASQRGLEPQVAEILKEARCFSRSYFIPGKYDQANDIHWTINLLLQRVLHVRLVSEQDSDFYHISDACRYAIAIFIFLPFDNHYPDPTMAINTLAYKLKFAVSKVVPRLGPMNELLVWALAIGGVACLNSPERGWFVGHLIPVIADLELSTWDEFRNALERVLWVKTFLDKPFRQLWEEIFTTTENLAELDPFTALFAHRSREAWAARLPERDGSFP